jgi:hypothetical protein
MNDRYIAARSAALGLTAGSELPPAQEYEALDIGQRALSGAELFSKTFDTPPDIIVRRSVLSLFDEYEDDYQQAHLELETISGMLRGGQLNDMAVFLRAKPPVEWLNCIFLEDDDIDLFALLLEGASPAARNILLSAVSEDLARLVNFKGLFAALLERYEFANDKQPKGGL